MTIDVQKLAAQAGVHRWAHGDRPVVHDWATLSRFAALVIEECARVCDNAKIGVASWEETDEILREVSAAIRALSPEAK